RSGLRHPDSIRQGLHPQRLATAPRARVQSRYRVRRVRGRSWRRPSFPTGPEAECRPRWDYEELSLFLVVARKPGMGNRIMREGTSVGLFRMASTARADAL